MSHFAPWLAKPAGFKLISFKHIKENLHFFEQNLREYQLKHWLHTKSIKLTTLFNTLSKTVILGDYLMNEIKHPWLTIKIETHFTETMWLRTLVYLNETPLNQS